MERPDDVPVLVDHRGELLAVLGRARRDQPVEALRVLLVGEVLGEELVQLLEARGERPRVLCPVESAEELLEPVVVLVQRRLDLLGGMGRAGPAGGGRSCAARATTPEPNRTARRPAAR